MSDEMRKKIALGVALAVLALSGLNGAAFAQTSRSVWDGVFTDAQAARGMSQYMMNCAICHGKALEGNWEAPPMIGEFVRDWAGTSLDVLFEKVSVTMPLNRQGALSAQANADILAFLLQANNFPAGAQELTTSNDVLKAISFDVFRPAPPTALKPKPAR